VISYAVCSLSVSGDPTCVEEQYRTVVDVCTSGLAGAIPMYVGIWGRCSTMDALRPFWGGGGGVGVWWRDGVGLRDGGGGMSVLPCVPTRY